MENHLKVTCTLPVSHERGSEPVMSVCQSPGAAHTAWEDADDAESGRKSVPLSFSAQK